MKYLKYFALFESIKLENLDIKQIIDTDSYTDYVAFVESGIAKGNFYKDFRMWVIYSAYKLATGDSVFSDYHNLENNKIIKDKTVYPTGYDGVNYFYEKLKEIQDFDINTFLLIISDNIKYLEPAPKSINDPVLKSGLSTAFVIAIRNSIKYIFMPDSTMSELAGLKFIDFVDEPSRISLGITDVLFRELNGVFEYWYKLEKDPEHLGKKFLKFLEAAQKYDICIIKEMEFSDIFNNAIGNYFQKAKDSFSVAGTLKKTNTPVFNKVAKIVPNLDISAGLGDMGF